MTKKLFLIVALLGASAGLSGCAAMAVGAGTAILADQTVEENRGGDGLF